MRFPIGVWELAFWIATTALLLLASTEVISASWGKHSLVIDMKKLRAAALIFGGISLSSIIVWIYLIS